MKNNQIIIASIIFLLSLNDLLPLPPSSAGSKKKTSSPVASTKTSTHVKQVVDAATYKESKPSVNESEKNEDDDDNDNEEKPLIDQITTWIKENKIAASTIFILILNHVYPRITEYLKNRNSKEFQKKAEEQARLNEQLKNLSPEGIKETLTKAFNESIKNTQSIKDLIELHKEIETEVTHSINLINKLATHANTNKKETFDSNSLAYIQTSFNEIKNTYNQKIKERLIVLIKEKLGNDKEKTEISIDETKRLLENDNAKIIKKEANTSLDAHAKLQAEAFLKKE